MQRVAVGWLVYRLTDSPLLLGVVSFAGQIPSFLLAPVAGALVALGWSRVIAVSLPLMALVGVGQMVVFAGSNTLLQSLVDDDKRGRVMSFYTMAFMGCGPLGYLAAGWLATHLGAAWTFTICGLAFAAGATVFCRRLPVLQAKARPVLLERGLLP